MLRVAAARRWATGRRGYLSIAANPCNFGIIENHWRTAPPGAYPSGAKYIEEVVAAGYDATDLVSGCN